MILSANLLTGEKFPQTRYSKTVVVVTDCTFMDSWQLCLSHSFYGLGRRRY